jgi:hypothetical protein
VRIFIGALVVCAALTFVACGGGAGGGGDAGTDPATADGERVLQLPAGDVTEVEFVAELRGNMAQNPAGFAAICGVIDGLSDREAFEAAVQGQSDDDSDVAVQEAAPTDEERVGAIMKAECERIN